MTKAVQGVAHCPWTVLLKIYCPERKKAGPRPLYLLCYSLLMHMILDFIYMKAHGRVSERYLGISL